MKKDSMHCKICEKELFSKIGKGCKMCAMPLENKNKSFCCDKCEEKDVSINNGGKIK